MNRSATKSAIRVLLLITLLGICSNGRTQNRNQKSSEWQLGGGSSYLYDDYLSPLPYQGTSLLFSWERIQPIYGGLSDSLDLSFDELKWHNHLQLSINPVYAQAKAGTHMFHGNLDLSDHVIRQLLRRPNYNLYGGGYLGIGGGGRYCLANGNNPGSADAYIDFGLTVQADYQFVLWEKPFKLIYQASMSMSGLAFSPEYAGSYYEIFYLKNTKNILKYSNPWNNQRWRQELSLNIPISKRKSSLRLNLRNDGHITDYNNIRTRILSTHLTAGYIRYFNVL